MLLKKKNITIEDANLQQNGVVREIGGRKKIEIDIVLELIICHDL
jgi:hypothetical protein